MILPPGTLIDLSVSSCLHRYGSANGHVAVVWRCICESYAETLSPRDRYLAARKRFGLDVRGKNGDAAFRNALSRLKRRAVSFRSGHVAISGNDGNLSVEIRPSKGIEPIAIVRRFYELITQKDYKSAWELLDLSYRKDRWGNSFDWFHDGFKGIVSSRLYHIVVHPLAPLPEFLVVLEEDVFHDPTSGLERFRNITLGDEDSQILETVQQIRNWLVKLGADARSFAYLPIDLLFRIDAPNTLRWSAKVPFDAWHALERPTRTVLRVTRVRLIEQQRGTWRIDRIHLLGH